MPGETPGRANNMIRSAIIGVSGERSFRASQHYIWRLCDSLGTGAFGEVFKGSHKRTGELVAVKAFRSRSSQMAFRQQFQELNILQRVEHPNIVRFIAVEDELVYTTSDPEAIGKVLVMEFCSGDNLSTELDDPENYFGFSELDFMTVLEHLTAGIRYLRENNLIHRDLKPSNILKTTSADSGILYKIGDFGAARDLEDSQKFGSIVGTEEYLSPDMYKYAKYGGGPDTEFSANSDLWSIGVTLYQLATGKLPFRPFMGRRDKDTMCKMITEKESDTISAVQFAELGPIETYTDLPSECRLRDVLCLRLTLMLRKLLESKKEKRSSFAELFDLSDDLAQFYEQLLIDETRLANDPVQADVEMISVVETVKNEDEQGFHLPFTPNFPGDSKMSKHGNKIATFPPDVSLAELANEKRTVEASQLVEADVSVGKVCLALVARYRQRVAERLVLLQTRIKCLNHLGTNRHHKVTNFGTQFASIRSNWSLISAQMSLLSSGHAYLKLSDGVLARAVSSAESAITAKRNSGTEIDGFLARTSNDISAHAALVDDLTDHVTSLGRLFAQNPLHDHPILPYLGDRKQAIAEILTQFRKNKTIKVYEDPIANLHTIQMHDLMRNQLKHFWKDTVKEMGQISIPIDAELRRLILMDGLEQKIRSVLVLESNIAEALQSAQDMIEAFRQSFYQEKDMKKNEADKGVSGRKVKRVAKERSPGFESAGAKRARVDGSLGAASGSGSPGASDTVMTRPVVRTIMAIMGTANTMGNATAAMVVKAWERPQVWDNFLPEKKKFVQDMIELCGAEYSDTKSAGAQYDIIRMAETERAIDQERREKYLRNQQLKALAVEVIKESCSVGADAKKSAKSGANEATDASSVSGKTPVEMPPPKVTFETASAVTVPKATTSKTKPKYRGAPITTYTKIAPAPGIVKDGAELFMECIYNAMEINIPATGAVDILGFLCNESNDGSFTKRKEGGTMTLPGGYAGPVCKAIGVMSTTTSDAGSPTYDIRDYGHIVKTSAIYNRLTETQHKPRGDMEVKFVSEAKAMELKREYEAEQKTMRDQQLAEMLKNLDAKPKVLPVKHVEILLDKLIPENETNVEPTTPAPSLTSSVGQQDGFHTWSTSEMDPGSSRPASSVAVPSPSTPNSQIIEQLGFHIRRLGENTPRIPKISPAPQEDDEVMIIEEVTADTAPRAARFIKEESHEDGEIIFTGTEPAILLPHLGGNDLLLPNDNPGPSQEGSQGLNVYQAANNKMDFHSLVWDDWANANNMQLLRMGILMSSKHDAVGPSIWTLTERGVPPYQECAEGFVRVPFISYAHNVAPTLLDTSEHLFAHRLWFCHYVNPPLLFRSDNTAPEEVVHCRAMIMDFVMSMAYTVPWVKSLNKFLSQLRNLERRCKLAMETLFRSRGGCNKEDYLLFVEWIDYTVGNIMEKQMDQCRLPCSEFDPQIAYPMRQVHIAKLALNHIYACLKGGRYYRLENKKETRELMNSRVFSVMNPDERDAVERAHIILNDAAMAGSDLPMTERMVEVIRARQTVMPTLKSFYGKVSIQLAAEMSKMLEINPETLNDRVATQRINSAE